VQLISSSSVDANKVGGIYGEARLVALRTTP
jgi:hypothetical protein